MTPTLALAAWRRGRWLFAGLSVLALVWLHLGVVFPRPTQTLVIRSEVPLFNVHVTMNGTELDGRYGSFSGGKVFAWAISHAERPSRFVLTWNTEDGRRERLESSGSFHKEALHCIHSLRVNAEGQAGRDDWMTICRCDPAHEIPGRTLSQGACL